MQGLDKWQSGLLFKRGADLKLFSAFVLEIMDRSYDLSGRTRPNGILPTLKASLQTPSGGSAERWR
jgi:hypothetical protein